MTEAAFLRMVACSTTHSQCSVCSCGCEIKVLSVETSLISSPYFHLALYTGSWENWEGTGHAWQNGPFSVNCILLVILAFWRAKR